MKSYVLDREALQEAKFSSSPQERNISSGPGPTSTLLIDHFGKLSFGKL